MYIFENPNLWNNEFRSSFLLYIKIGPSKKAVKANWDKKLSELKQTFNFNSLSL